MNKRNAAGINDQSLEFREDLKRRLAVAQDPQKRIRLDEAKKNVLLKYKRLVRASV